MTLLDGTRRHLVLATAVLVSCGALVAQRSRGAAGDGGAGKALTVCAEPASMPRTGKAPDGTPQGIDARVAQLLGRTLGRTIEFHWCGSAECSWHCLPEGRCDVVLGQPRDSSPPRDVAWSVPYAGGQFGLVVGEESLSVTSLADLRGKRIGIVTGSVALSEKDHMVARFKSREEVLSGFKASSLDAAFVDADFAAWYLHEHPQLKLRLVTEYVPREHWNMALAVRAKDAQLLSEINRALSQLAQSGEIRKVYADHGVPFRAPFTDLARRPAPLNTWPRIVNRGELVVSMDPANLPYSSAKEDRPGFDVELARELAKELQVKLRIEWLDIQHETAIGKLLEGECDLVLGAAVDPNAVVDDEELADKVVYSRPYYGTGYLLVHKKNGPKVESLSELKGERAERLGTEAGSVADYRLRQRGYLRLLFRNQLATLTALDQGDIDFAYLWANVGWMLHTSPEFNLELLRGYVPEDHWNIAIGMRKGDQELKRHVDAALEALIKNGTVTRALAHYHVPYFPPFAEPDHASQANTDGVIRHKVADRGREPQMQRVQASKNPYSGLARVRSAGELVVGLDQNNLPFSTAHPEPSGLDYEIACQLAKELGVAPRIYWAYSSHDSYPSHLAAKKRCDVILGVTPDDRFEQRVLFSKPYYFMSFQFVVRTGASSPPIEGAIAVENGVAVRGLRGRKVQTFADLDTMLNAVASGQVAAGYAISARGNWLAQKRWPGKLQFLAPEEDLDRFPICAAVRKADADLKEAIDRAFLELDRSGWLSKEFARWNVPYDSRVGVGNGSERAR
ncbi:MAG TPA: transporter substrate-binding domain-containing protein [Isosphaeraceae bacterium]|nr:transporter substrate-binding domain-containing protein [Isosphaeraceae bacterium]